MTYQSSSPYKLLRIRRIADRSDKLFWLFPYKRPVYEIEISEVATGKLSVLRDLEASHFLSEHYHSQDEWDIRNTVNVDWPKSLNQWRTPPFS